MSAEERAANAQAALRAAAAYQKRYRDIRAAWEWYSAGGRREPRWPLSLAPRAPHGDPLMGSFAGLG